MSTPRVERHGISLRVGNAERERCVAELLNHHLDGRLDAEEYDRRERQALSAVTVEDLLTLTADFPVSEAATRPRPGLSNLIPRDTRGITASVHARRDVRRLWPVAVLWSGALVAQGGSTADWWHINDDITSGFVMASFGFATHWVITKFKS